MSDDSNSEMIRLSDLLRVETQRVADLKRRNEELAEKNRRHHNECLFCSTRFSAVYDECPVCSARDSADALAGLLTRVAKQARNGVTKQTVLGPDILADIDAALAQHSAGALVHPVVGQTEQQETKP